MLQTPVLLITFNRAKNTQSVINALRLVKPKFLYVFQDGQRIDNIDDIDKCKSVRNVLSEIDWECELKTNFSESNLGCGKGPSTGIQWFFENVEEGIILEDDCIPHPDFFQYCEILLEKYRNDVRISYIGGANYQDGKQRGDGSYYFSDGHHGTWGWASWRRSWQLFDYYIDNINVKRFKDISKKYFIGKIMKDYWLNIFYEVKKNRFNESCWDYQFYFGCWNNNMLAILPNKNLVANIGDDPDANHTQGNLSMLYRPTESILPIIHPTKVYQDKKADFFIHKVYVQPYDYGWSGFKRIPHRLNKRLKKLLNKQGSWFR